MPRNKSRLLTVMMFGGVLAFNICVGSAASAATQAKNSSKLESQAKITMEHARAIALKRAPGEVKSEELEKEHGKLVYSFDIQEPNQKDITEVQVSAVTGSIINIHKESAAAEADEAKREKSKKQPSAPQTPKKP